MDTQNALLTTKIGTLTEMTGLGFEILVDSETRSYVLARFFNGEFVTGQIEKPTLEQSMERTAVCS